MEDIENIGPSEPLKPAEREAISAWIREHRKNQTWKQRFRYRYWLPWKFRLQDFFRKYF